MTKERAKERLEELVNSLKNLSDKEIFSNHNNKLDKIIEEIALVDIDEVEKETLDNIWEETEPKTMMNYPQNRYNLALNYATKIIELIKEDRI